jgi:hypothetical protein
MKIPVIGVVVSAIVGLLFLLPFPSWARWWTSSPAPRC